MMNEIEIIECPICMDSIDSVKNKVTTECGHCFHASCLMTNVAHNGFGCPYCRTAMTEEVAADEDSDDDYDEFSINSEEEPDYNNHVLRGARWLFQRAEGEEVDDSDESESESDDEEEAQRVEVEPRPTVDYIVEKLVQRGVSMEDLVKSILLRDHDEYQFHDEFERGDSELFGKIRIIISNFRPTPPAPALAPAPAQQEPVVLEEGKEEEDEHLFRQGVINDSNFEKFNQYWESYYSSERMTRYEKMSSLVQQYGRNCDSEDKFIKQTCSFQMKGSCRNELV